MMKKIMFSLFIITLIFQLSAFSFELSYAQPRRLPLPGCPLMEESELIDKINSGERRLLIVDVRIPQDYKKGHIPGAISIPGGDAERLALEIDKKRDKTVVVGGDGEFAWIVCRNMKIYGHQYVHSLNGGMSNWNGPVEE